MYDLKFKRSYIETILHFFIITLVFVLQSANFLPKIYGYDYNLLPVIAISLAILTPVYQSVILTFYITFLSDFNFSSVEGLTTIYYVSAVIIISFVVDKFFTKTFVTNMLFVSVTLLIVNIFRFTFYYILIDSSTSILYFKICCAEILISTLLSPIVYTVINITSFIFKERK